MVDSSAVEWIRLVAAARGAREHAYAPYSDFRVGAAVLTEGGSIFAGCNVENRTYGLTLCAERVALASAVAGGHRRVQAIAVLTDTAPPAAPCGLCLQALEEFADPELPILLVNLDGEQRQHRLRELLPHPFQLPKP